MSGFWTAVIAFLVGEVLGIVEMAILGGQVDRWLDRRAKKKGR